MPWDSFLSCIVSYNSHDTHTPTLTSPQYIDIVNKCLEIVRASFQDIWKEHNLKPWELPGCILLHHEAFTTENRLLSSLQKLCRPALTRKFASKLYKEELSVNSVNSDVDHGHLDPLMSVHGGEVMEDKGTPNPSNR